MKSVSQLSDILRELSTFAPLVRGENWHKIILNQNHQAASPVICFVGLWIKTLFFLISLLPQYAN